MKITKKSSVLELAAIITKTLNEEGVSAVLVGGSVVSIYTDNEYKSKDLDFISSADHKKIVSIMKTLGFEPLGKDFHHPQSSFSVEFPSGPLGIGDRVPIKAEGEIEIHGTKIKLLSPTQSVMDRLAWFYFSDDRQCLDQAISVCLSQIVDLKEIKKWSTEENMEEKFEIFKKSLKVRTGK